MKNITKLSIHKDIDTIYKLVEKFNNAIWENQEGQIAHFDNQHKMVKICIEDTRVGLNIALMALKRLEDLPFTED